MQNVPLNHFYPDTEVSREADLPSGAATPRIRKPFRILRDTATPKAPVTARAEPVAVALAKEEVLHTSALATITNNFILVNRREPGSETIIGLSRVSKLKRIELRYPGLLVVAAACFLLAAGANCSKEANQAGVPLAVLGAVFVISYFLTRRASVAFVVETEATETCQGSLPEAAAVIKTMAKLYQFAPASKKPKPLSIRNRRHTCFVGGWDCYDFRTIHLTPANQRDSPQNNEHGS